MTDETDAAWSDEADGGMSLPFNERQVATLIRSLVEGARAAGTELTEFQAREFLLWARSTYADNIILSLALKGKLRIGDVRHAVEETCTFTVAAR